MTAWDARDYLLERDPVRALRAERVDPLPPRPKPCTCDDSEKIEVHDMAQAVPDLICGGVCQYRAGGYISPWR